VELALNLVWLVLAALSLLLWGISAFSMQRRNSNFAAATALVCILCFLFPVISISDDLNSNPALCETSKSKKSVSTDDLNDARSLSELVLPFHPGLALRPAAHLVAEVSPSREHFWFNLDRRPPPQRF
jgi:hypothetical protein